MPIGNRGSRNAAFIGTRVQKGVQGHRATIAPAPDADAVFIKRRILCKELIEGGQLILQLDHPEPVTNGRGHEIAAPVRRTAIIEGKNRIAVLCHHLVEGSAYAAAPGIAHCQDNRTSVDEDDDWNFAAGWS